MILFRPAVFLCHVLYQRIILDVQALYPFSANVRPRTPTIRTRLLSIIFLLLFVFQPKGNLQHTRLQTCAISCYLYMLR